MTTVSALVSNEGDFSVLYAPIFAVVIISLLEYDTYCRRKILLFVKANPVILHIFLASFESKLMFWFFGSIVLWHGWYRKIEKQHKKLLRERQS